MLSYETLDAIADGYTPLLAIISLILIGSTALRLQWRFMAQQVLAFSALLGIVYGFMFVDRRLGLWSVFGLDYSTHTALALGLVVFICSSASNTRVFYMVSFIGYVFLMLYQHYHTLSDIVTTGIAVGVPMALVMAYLYRGVNRLKQSNSKA